MASNKFATMLHRNTHKIAVILVYMVLEWTLIAFLLLNSLFFYLIIKFANFFGLKPPCMWCSRIDHVLEPTRKQNSCRDLICDMHGSEISKLGYCLNHRKLAESGHMCPDCLLSRPGPDRSDHQISFFPIVNEMDMNFSEDGATKKKLDEGRKDLGCSCCGAGLGTKFYPPYLVFKPSWGVLDYAQKKNPIKDRGEEEDEICGFHVDGLSDLYRSECPTDHDDSEIRGGDEVEVNQAPVDVFPEKCVEGSLLQEEKEERPECPGTAFGFEETEEDGEIGSMVSDQEDSEDESRILLEGAADFSHSIEDASSEVCAVHFCRFPQQDRLVPIEFIDSITFNDYILHKSENEDEEKSEISKQLTSTRMVQGLQEKPFSTRVTEKNAASEILETESVDRKDSAVFFTEESNLDLVEGKKSKAPATVATQMVADNGDAEFFLVIENDSDECIVVEDRVINDEDKSKSSMDGDFCHGNQERIPLLPCHDGDHPFDKYNSSLDSTSRYEHTSGGTQVTEQSRNLIQREDSCLASKSMSEIEYVEMVGPSDGHHLASCSELIEMEEEKQPEKMISYMESIHNLHKRILFERKESEMESLDGSVISEFEGGEVLTVDHLKLALNAERKALNALYAELEEERSASAIATNQTMAMITRLQEEKAAMQMEALQYQRMMEEQSEYDQEALQLLNEITVKREKEKQDLEKELDLYRKKVLLYEARYKRMVKEEKAKRSNGVSSAYSSADDSDGLSVDLNQRDDFLFGRHESNQNTPADEVLAVGVAHDSMKQLSMVDESLAEFEEERLSILEQLRALEEKLFTMAGEEKQFEDIKSIENYMEEDGHEGRKNCEFCNQHENMAENGFFEEFEANEVHNHQGRNMYSKAKKLLPFFDAMSMENEENLNGGHNDHVLSDNNVCKFTLESKKLAIEEEVDHVYERLEALEADREFLKHCISSIKKGDEGIVLLHEILQHLRDLRCVKLRARNSSEKFS